MIGARAMGIGNTSACLSDPWSIFNNAGGLAKVKHSAAAFTYEAHPSFPSFNRMAALFTLPVKPGVIATGVYRFGDDLYNEQILTAGFSNSFGLASLGLKVNYIQYHAEGFGNTRAMTVSFGGIADLTPHFSVGAHIVNINQPKLSNVNDERLPTLLILGLGFKPSEKLFITSEVEKDLDYQAIWKTGVEYHFHSKFIARTGFNLKPQAAFAGVGFKPKKFDLDYAFQYNPNSGPCHQATVSYQFKSK